MKMKKTVMRGRPKSERHISYKPAVSYFTPNGTPLNKRKRKVFLLIEEYEAFRLCDYEGLCHLEAAELMGVSRPTLTRIYGRARKKIAKAFVEGLPIVIEGPKVELDGSWWVCNKCKAVFTLQPEKPRACALCRSHKIAPYPGANADAKTADASNDSAVVADSVKTAAADFLKDAEAVAEESML